jgi:ferredoxin
LVNFEAQHSLNSRITVRDSYHVTPVTHNAFAEMAVPSSLIPHPSSLVSLARDIKLWGEELGFQQVGIAGCDLGEAETRLLDWLARGYHGEMEYMERHGTKRSRPHDLVPGTLRVIAARMNYLPPAARDSWDVLGDGSRAYVSRYALGRDYHKVMRGRMQKLADRVAAEIGEFRARIFTDSAPVLEVELAKASGLGWRGKHTLLLNRDAGSYFFLGEIYTDLPLPIDDAQADHCGTCRKCIDICPTRAIVAPYQLDARRCISYLTIEHKGKHSGGPAPRDRQQGVRLRRLPARLPVEQVRLTQRRTGFRGEKRPRRLEPGRAFFLERAGFSGADGRQRDLPHRIRALVEEYRRGAR